MKLPARRLRDPYCAISHFVGFGLSIAGLVVLLCFASPSPRHYISFSIYGVSLCLLYLASAMTHSINQPSRHDKYERLDYIAIFLLIAGTYTPLCLNTLRGPLGWTLFGIEWGLALFGTILVLSSRLRPKKVTTPLYLIMGWLVVTAVVPLARVLPTAGLLWLIAGGLAYSIGAVIFTLERPDLWPGKFKSHDLWHTLVLAGSGCHFVVMLWFVA